MAKKNCIICQKEAGKIAGNKTADKSTLCDDCASEMGLPITMKNIKIIKKSSDAELRSRHAEMAGLSTNEFEDFKSGQVKEITIDFKSAEKATITLDQTGITIDKKGLLNAMTVGITGAKKVPFASITGVHFKERGKITSGVLQFSILGVAAAASGLSGAAEDKYAVMFANKEEEKKAMQIRDFVDEKISGGGAFGGTTIVQEKSPAEEVKALKELLDMGVLTQEEFDRKKKELLGL
ncbi:MAG: SHOCT domain-containing protein [Turicibacter sp.]|nr:SHOCT domain-containing protein [Turicibacter sp.]